MSSSELSKTPVNVQLRRVILGHQRAKLPSGLAVLMVPKRKKKKKQGQGIINERRTQRNLLEAYTDSPSITGVRSGQLAWVTKPLAPRKHPPKEDCKKRSENSQAHNSIYIFITGHSFEYDHAVWLEKIK